MTSRRSIDWSAIWRQVSEIMEKNNASPEAKEAVAQTEWKVNGDKFFLYCPKALYEWIEVPASAEQESNLCYIKPILWPAIQRLGCRTLIYKLI